MLALRAVSDVVDPGRHGGIRALQASPYNLLSPWSDGPYVASLKNRHVDLQPSHLRTVGGVTPCAMAASLMPMPEFVRSWIISTRRA
jgi:hypothetical protein